MYLFLLLLHFRTFSGAAFTVEKYSTLRHGQPNCRFLTKYCPVDALVGKFSVGTKGVQRKHNGCRGTIRTGGTGGRDGRVFGCFFFSVSCFSLGLPVFWVACF